MKNENTDAIFSILDSQPWTDQAKAAIMGTIFAESKFDPGILNEDPEELSWGLFQYRNVPQEKGMSAPDPRKNKLFNYLESQGLGRDSADGQLEYFLKDVKKNYPSVYEVLTDRDATIDEATEAITNNYIMPHESVRSERYGHARKYANLYGLDAGPESNVEIQGENDMSVLDNLDIDALTTLAGGQENAETALKLARALRPKAEEFDPAIASLLYFTKMGELASQPGSTLLGSASGAFMSPTEYLMRTKKSQRDALAAEGPLAVDFAKAIKGTKRVPKTVGTGTLATFLSKEDAIEFVKGLGMDESNSNFNRMVDFITAPEESMIGSLISQGGAYVELNPMYIGDELINFQISPSKNAAPPGTQIYKSKRLPIISKNFDDYASKASQIIPRVNDALELLKTGEVDTGGVTRLFLPFKRLSAQLFNISDTELEDIESLESLSNFLAPKMRPPGSGSTSDMEFEAYQKAILDIGNTPLSNYISLYAFKKMTEKGVIAQQTEMSLLMSDRPYTPLAISNILKVDDKGIFEKYEGDLENENEIQEWYDSLPNGAVILNSNGAIDSDKRYIVKGWQGVR
jgi:hypothetical protein